MDMLAAVDKNGCRRLVDVIETHDPGFVKWGKERLAKAKEVSTAFPNRNHVI